MPDPFGYQTLDEMAREGVKAGTLKKAVVIEGSHLPKAEVQRLENMDGDERLAARDEAWFKTHPISGTVTTGQDMWDANGGRSPNQDDVERLSEGRYRRALDENAEFVPGMVEEVATGKHLSLEVLKARKILELAEN